ncbi:MAG: S-layer homology domain-containing protein [Oscillospiraceae bacterium]|nr:S-layer homology domain-containing protein [Oscillospiraceae bacterium]
MKKFLCILLIVALATALLPVSVSASALSFSDVDPNAWYVPGISYVTDHGIMIGTSPERFSPHQPVTRGMMVTVLWRLAQEPIVNTEEEFWLYRDIPLDAYYASAADWAKVNEIMVGYPIDYNPADPPNGFSLYNFRPEESLARQQLATVLYRYAKLLGMNTGTASNALQSFPDKSDVSPWAKEAMQWCVDAGLLRGTTCNGLVLLDPKGTTSRAQLATVLLRFADLLSKS